MDVSPARVPNEAGIWSEITFSIYLYLSLIHALSSDLQLLISPFLALHDSSKCHQPLRSFTSRLQFPGSMLVSFWYLRLTGRPTEQYPLASLLYTMTFGIRTSFIRCTSPIQRRRYPTEDTDVRFRSLLDPAVLYNFLSPCDVVDTLQAAEVKAFQAVFRPGACRPAFSRVKQATKYT